MEDKLFDSASDKEIVLFGAGEIGEWVIKYLKLCGKKVVAVTDNNENLCGTKFHGIKILEPKEVVNKYPATLYIVANMKHFETIRQQLLSCNISKDKIKICSDKAWIIKSVYQKKKIKSIKENRFFIYDTEHWLTAKYLLRKCISVILEIYYKLIMNFYKTISY